MEKKDTPEKIITVIAFLSMVAFTMLSIFLPMNGRSIIKIAASYPNLITPADYTFVIWWFIYLLFMAFSIYQLELFGHKHFILRPEALFHTRIVFAGFCVLCIIWVIAWQFEYLALSAVLLFIMVIGIRFLCKYLSREDMSAREKIFVRLPFSVLYGWLTILTISGFAVLFESIRWKAFGVPLAVWAVTTLVVLAVYAAIRTQRNRDLAYCITLIWAYIGILVKRTAKDELYGQNPLLIAAVTLCVAILAGSAGILIYRKRKI